MNRCIIGDSRDVLRQLAQGGARVQTCVTSPPYWGLRDYGAPGQLGLEPLHDCLGWATGDKCGECHVCHMVEVFALVRGLLADDGTCWVNYGDSYAGSWGAQGRQGQTGQMANRSIISARQIAAAAKKKTRTGSTVGLRGLKPKDLVMMPARIALALQADGWWLRQDIIWHKPNPMPESITDRCTKSHEYVFLLAKSERYYYDAEAIRETASDKTHARRKIVPAGWATGDAPHTAVAHQTARTHRKLAQAGSGVKNNESMDDALAGMPDTRNKRDVWTIASRPYEDAHFATYPPDLIEPCILAGSRPGDIVLDPFFGSGTTGEVAERLGRQWIGIELNPEYGKLAAQRTAQTGMVL